MTPIASIASLSRRSPEVVDRPLPQLQREVELRLTRDVRTLDFAALLDADAN